MRILLIPLALLAQAAGGLRWLLWPISDPQDRARRRDCWGWLSPEMEPHWRTLAAATGFSGRYEAMKNIVSEWTRLDAQRGSKIILAWLLLLGIGSLGAVLVLHFVLSAVGFGPLAR